MLPRSCNALNMRMSYFTGTSPPRGPRGLEEGRCTADSSEDALDERRSRSRVIDPRTRTRSWRRKKSRSHSELDDADARAVARPFGRVAGMLGAQEARAELIKRLATCARAASSSPRRVRRVGTAPTRATRRVSQGAVEARHVARLLPPGDPRAFDKDNDRRRDHRAALPVQAIRRGRPTPTQPLGQRRARLDVGQLDGAARRGGAVVKPKIRRAQPREGAAQRAPTSSTRRSDELDACRS